MATLGADNTVDGLRDVVLRIGPDCVDGGFFLRLIQVVKCVSPVSKKESTRRVRTCRTYQIGKASRALPQSTYGAAVI